MRTESKVDISGAVDYLRRKRASVATARNVVSESGFAFDLVNNARDDAANYEPHRIYYYQVVDEGRGEVVAGENKTNRFPVLHFKISPTEWRVMKRVGPSRPRRITETAKARLHVSLPEEVADAFATISSGRVPDGPAMLFVLRRMQSFIIKAFREATIDTYGLEDRRRAYYGVEAPPLADSFETIER